MLEDKTPAGLSHVAEVHDMTENLLFTFQALVVRWGPPKLSCWEPAPGEAEGAAAGIPGLQPGWEHPSMHTGSQAGAAGCSLPFSTQTRSLLPLLGARQMQASSDVCNIDRSDNKCQMLGSC